MMVQVKKPVSKIEKQNKDLIQKTIELTELKGALEDKNYYLEQKSKELKKQNVEVVQKTFELNELKGVLEDRNADLESANKQISSLLKIKTEFMNQAAHDLRTPLTPILTLLPIVKGKVKNKELKHDINIIENNARYLHQIVEELISFVKLDQSKTVGPIFENIDIVDLINEVISNEESVFKINRIKVYVNSSKNLPRIKGQRLKLVEVIQNIIANAVKFMPMGGNIRVKVTRNTKFIYVKVKDSGMGMTKNTLYHVFDTFFRADISRHSIKGSGLGLSICKKIIESHDGTIWAESAGLSKGSTIAFKLPIQENGAL